MIVRSRIKKVIDALRSGKYPQGSGMLKTSSGRYCCLGVMCEVYGEENGVKFEENPEAYNTNFFLGDMTYLPTAVARWFGIEDEESGTGYVNPRIHNSELIQKYRWLAPFVKNPSFADNLNDRDVSFAEIADAMEKEYLTGSTT